MSDVNEHEALLWVPRPWDYIDPDIAGGSRERPLDLGSKTKTPTRVQVSAPPLPVAGKKKAKNGKGSGDKREKESIGGSGGAGVEPDHEMHIWTERERRKKMRNMFASLHALLPQLPSKLKDYVAHTWICVSDTTRHGHADKSTIVDEAVIYIKHCQQTLQKLNLERLHGITPTVNNEKALVSPQTLVVDSRESFLADHIASNNVIAPSNTSKAIMTPRFNVPLSFQSFNSQNVVLNLSGDQAFINICVPKRKGLFATICLVVEKHKLELISSHVTSDLDKMTIMMQVQTKIRPDQYPEGFPVDEVYKKAAVEIMNVVSSYCYQI